MPRGGARKGAGRPRSERKTKVVRVPLEIAPSIAHHQQLISILRRWKAEAEVHQSTARWKNIKKLMDEIEGLI